jgi:hypothetical protein
MVQRRSEVDLQAGANDEGMVVAIHAAAGVIADLGNDRVDDVLRVQGQVIGLTVTATQKYSGVIIYPNFA